LNLIDIGDNNFINFARKSMVKDDLDSELKEIYYAISKEQSEAETLEETFKTMQTPITVVNEYLKLLECHTTVVNKKRKDIERQIDNIHDEYVNLKFDKVKVERYNKKLKKIDDLQDQYNFVEKYIDNNVETIVNLLQDDGFVQIEKENQNETNEIKETKITLTARGMIATHLKETHCLVFAQLFEENVFDKLNSIQIIMLLSCLTNIVVKDEYKNYVPKTDDVVLKELVFRVKNMYNDYITKETNLNINSGIEYMFHYDLLNYVDKWCYCENAEECKQLLQKLEEEKEIFLGEFVKALLKINNICSELEKIAELFGNMSLLSKLKEIPIMTLKYVVTNQSLYV
jgi:predicted  nucleic acid-binding Zn-ribbon protein